MNTAFTTLDKDGDSVLPNGELVDTVTLVSEMEWMRRRIRMQEPMLIISRLHQQRLERQR